MPPPSNACFERGVTRSKTNASSLGLYGNNQKLINYEENCQPDEVTASMEEEREQSATKLLILQMWWMQNALTEKPGQKRYKKKTSGQASTLPSHRKAGKCRWPPTCFYKHRFCSKKYEDVPQKIERKCKETKKKSKTDKRRKQKKQRKNRSKQTPVLHICKKKTQAKDERRTWNRDRIRRQNQKPRIGMCGVLPLWNGCAHARAEQRKKKRDRRSNEIQEYGNQQPFKRRWRQSSGTPIEQQFVSICPGWQILANGIEKKKKCWAHRELERQSHKEKLLFRKVRLLLRRQQDKIMWRQYLLNNEYASREMVRFFKERHDMWKNAEKNRKPKSRIQEIAEQSWWKCIWRVAKANNSMENKTKNI